MTCVALGTLCACPGGDDDSSPMMAGTDGSSEGTEAQPSTTSEPGSGSSDTASSGPSTDGPDPTTGGGETLEPETDSGETEGNPPSVPSGCESDVWIGVPEPPFGLHDEHIEYEGVAGFVDGPNGPYSHWVDNTAPSCSDAANGTEDTPRCSIPTSLSSGSVVEVHGGPYLLEDQTTTFAFGGTAQEPVWLRGIDSVVIDAGGGNNRQWLLSGSYFVVEGFSFQGGATVSIDADHYGFRDNEVDFGERNCVNAGGSDGVVFGNELHHCHRQPGSQDAHGVQVLLGSERVWVVGNDIHHNFGNGIQWGHAGEQNPPDHIYIAGNTIHQDRETGIASKWSNRAVISCNTIYGYRPSAPNVEWCSDDDAYCNTPSSGSSGQAIVHGADGFPQEEWVVFNHIYDAAMCVRVEEAVRVNFVGNVCHDTTGGGIRLEKDGDDTHFLHNTLFNIGTDGGGAMVQQDWRQDFERMRFDNNIFHTTAGLTMWFEDFGAVVPSMHWNNNIHFNGGAPIRLEWRGEQSVATSEELQALISADAASAVSNLVEDPLFADESAADFSLLPESPARDAGNDSLIALDAEYKATFGDDVGIIPACWNDGAFDIGASCD